MSRALITAIVFSEGAERCTHASLHRGTASCAQNRITIFTIGHGEKCCLGPRNRDPLPGPFSACRLAVFAGLVRVSFCLVVECESEGRVGKVPCAMDLQESRLAFADIVGCFILLILIFLILYVCSKFLDPNFLSLDLGMDPTGSPYAYPSAFGNFAPYVRLYKHLILSIRNCTDNRAQLFVHALQHTGHAERTGRVWPCKPWQLLLHELDTSSRFSLHFSVIFLAWSRGCVSVSVSLTSRSWLHTL